MSIPQKHKWKEGKIAKGKSCQGFASTGNGDRPCGSASCKRTFKRKAEKAIGLSSRRRGQIDQRAAMKENEGDYGCNWARKISARKIFPKL